MSGDQAVSTASEWAMRAKPSDRHPWARRGASGAKRAAPPIPDRPTMARQACSTTIATHSCTTSGACPGIPRCSPFPGESPHTTSLPPAFSGSPATRHAPAPCRSGVGVRADGIDENRPRQPAGVAPCQFAAVDGPEESSRAVSKAVSSTMASNPSNDRAGIS